MEDQHSDELNSESGHPCPQTIWNDRNGYVTKNIVVDR